MESFRLPENFLLGTATSSLQIEGGDRNNSWYRWAEQGKVKDGTHCIIADDHWNRVEEDIALMKRLNLSAYRMSIEWSRIEPARGEFNQKAMDHYRGEVEKLVAAGVQPMVTLHHFSNPLWLEEIGAWTNEEVISLFGRYAQYVVRNLGDLVSHWITLNEPNVYLLFGYIDGIWPPGEKGNVKAYFRGARYMSEAHIAAYHTIHKVRRELQKDGTMVGVANHLRVFDPKKSLMDMWVSRKYDRLFQEIFVCGMTEGKWLSPLGFSYFLQKGKFADFFGVNYYSRDIVSFTLDPFHLFGKVEVRQGASVNDLGWEIYPEGLYRLCKKYFTRYRLPIYITENGTCDAKDAFRIRYIYDHLLEVKRLLDEGVDVRGYYCWSLLDNFEWLDGLSARFGLIEVNYSTQERTIRKSGEFYGDVCRKKGVDREMIEKYLKT